MGGKDFYIPYDLVVIGGVRTILEGVALRLEEFKAGLECERGGGGGYGRNVGLESSTHFVSALVFRVVEVLGAFGLGVAKGAMVIALRDFGSWETWRLGGGYYACTGGELGSLGVRFCGGGGFRGSLCCCGKKHRGLLGVSGC